MDFIDLFSGAGGLSEFFNLIKILQINKTVFVFKNVCNCFRN